VAKQRPCVLVIAHRQWALVLLLLLLLPRRTSRSTNEKTSPKETLHRGLPMRGALTFGVSR